MKEIISKINKELKNAKKVKIKEIDAVKLSDGILSVNERYYIMSFNRMSPHNERIFTFQKIKLDNILNDLKNGNFKNIENYIEEYKLDVIEDSTYRIKEILLMKE